MISESIYSTGWSAGWEPEKLLTVSEWADEYRILSSQSSAEPGRWRTDRTPYLREILDCFSSRSNVTRIGVMASAQVGKTSCIENAIGYVIDHNPCPIMVSQATIDLAELFSTQKVAPMLETCPTLKSKIKPAKSRDSGNKILLKEFPGGVLRLSGANSAASLRSFTCRYLLMDEIDAYPNDIEGEGDPLELADKRTTTFGSRKKLGFFSTPTVKGLSKIESLYLSGDQRRYFVPCPHCGNYDYMRWPNIHWEGRDADTAKLACEACGQLIEERYKTQMLMRGEWRPTAEGDGETRTYHISGLMSPLGWKSWAQIVKIFLRSKNDPSKLKTWVNTELGETWAEEGDEINTDLIRNRKETYPAEVPDGVLVLTAAVDVQGDRLESKIIGWGKNEESWLIAVTQIHGDPALDATWYSLDEFLWAGYAKQDGTVLNPAVTFIDSGGHHTDQVYKFCRSRVNKRVYAIKGASQSGKEIVGRPTTNNRYHAKLFMIGTETAKDMIFARLKIKSPGPGYMHFPDWTDDEYFEQMTSEKSVRKYVKGKGAVREYIKTRERNEALDLEVYNLAAFYSLGEAFRKNLNRQTVVVNAEIEEQKEQLPVKHEIKKPVVVVRGGGSWVNSWR